MHCHLQLLRPYTKGCCGSDVQPKIGDREFNLEFAGLLLGNLKSSGVPEEGCTDNGMLSW